MRGAADEGAEVLDLGLVGTEMVYFAVGKLELDGGIMVTASHNPKEYTGMKIVRRGALPVGGESGLLDVRDKALAVTDLKGGGEGRVSAYDIWPEYVDRVLSFIDVSAVQAAEGRDRRGERDGRRDAAAGAGAAADRGGAVLLRSRRLVPEPRAEPAAAGEPRVHRGQDARRRAPISASRSTATRIAASSSTTAASSSRATSRRRCSRGRCSRRSRARRSSTTCARAGRCRRRSRRRAACR